MLLVGLTGGIGAGKSTVARMLTERGAVVLDADAVAREVVEPGEPAFAALVEEFGPEIVGADGRLDRPALAAIAFATDESRAALEAITHPAIHAEFGRRMTEAPTDAIVVMDVPLLVESGTAAERGYEAVIVVEAPGRRASSDSRSGGSRVPTPRPAWPRRPPTTNGGRSRPTCSTTPATSRRSRPRSTRCGPTSPAVTSEGDREGTTGVTVTPHQ